jgi:hypothetical protein
MALLDSVFEGFVEGKRLLGFVLTGSVVEQWWKQNGGERACALAAPHEVG